MQRKLGIPGGRARSPRFGDEGYAAILVCGVNFRWFAGWQRAGRWTDAAAARAQALEGPRMAGAGFGLIAMNSVHIVYDEAQRAVGMALVSIVDATAEAMVSTDLQ